MKFIDVVRRLGGCRILSAALITVLVGGCLYIYFVWDHAAVHVQKAAAEYPLIDPARHLIPQEHFLSTLQPLRERVHAYVDTQEDVNISVYIEYLNTGANIIVKPEERFWPASLSKVPLALAVMGTVESNVWTLDQVLTLEEEDRMSVSSTLHTHPIGTKFTVRELLEELLVRSDNTAYRILGRNVPESEIVAVKEALGLEDLFDAEGEVTAREYTRILRSLYTASYLNRKHSQFLLDILNRAEWKDFLRQSVPESVPFPHKYGADAERNTFSDSGIVYIPQRPYLITVMIEAEKSAPDAVSKARAQEVMQAISRMAYEYFLNAQNREL